MPHTSCSKLVSTCQFTGQKCQQRGAEWSPFHGQSIALGNLLSAPDVSTPHPAVPTHPLLLWKFTTCPVPCTLAKVRCRLDPFL